MVLPTFNEVQTIETVLRRTRAALPDAGILVVDDGSPDGTASLARRVAAELGELDVLERDSQRGLGDAYRAGFKWGMARGAEVLVEMDSDLSHDPAALPSLVAPMVDHDLVIGSRYIPGGSIPKWGIHRRLLSRGANWYSAFMLGSPVHDWTSGFRAYRTSILSTMELETVRADGYGFQIEMTHRAAAAGARIAEVPISFVDRKAGQSKMSYGIILEAFALVTRSGIKRRLAAGRRRGRARSEEPIPSGRP
ncbi:MAG: polyprenol monophosphomannose synthase [Acidimicrobiales bacterium]|nr:polyprenol monophosphomannose synthase [Acidimicrobiales bacterium]